MHIGNIQQALFDFALAHQQGGKFVLRIEDTDQTRSTADAEEIIKWSLRWLGLQWDEGPDVGGPFGPYRQSERLPIYQAHAQRLVDQGDAYYCTCSPERLAAVRQQQQANKQPPGYDRHCRDLGLSPKPDELHVIRMKMPLKGENVLHDLIRGELRRPFKDSDDQVIIKSDGFPTYHLAVVVDDHLMEISHVIRAEEWISSVPKHLTLYRMFDWEPPRFAHTPLLRNPDKSKLSKRKNPTSVPWYERQGYLPETLINFLGLLGGSMPDGREFFSLQEFIDAFSFDRFVTSGPIFDMEKLNSLNGQYIRGLAPDMLLQRLIARDYVRAQVPLVQERMRTLNEFHTATEFFFAEDLTYDLALLYGKRGTSQEAAAWLKAVRERVADFRPFESAPLEETLRALVAEHEWNTGQVFMAVRVALTGSTQSPPLTETMAVLGRETTLKRLDAAAKLLTAD
jgi:glutamyl-tRNA synthetase